MNKKNAFDLTVVALREQGLNSDQILEELSRLFKKLSEATEEYQILDTTEIRIKEVLKKLCVPTKLNGYKYWIDAIRLYKKVDKIKMMDMYYQIAQIYDSTSVSVSKAMELAVEKCVQKCSTETLKSVFGDNISFKYGSKPKNSEFLTAVADLI